MVQSIVSYSTHLISSVPASLQRLCTKKLNIESLQSIFTKLYKDVSEKVSARGRKVVSFYKKSTSVVGLSLEVGDIVLVRRATDRGHKLLFKWLVRFALIKSQPFWFTAFQNSMEAIHNAYKPLNLIQCLPQRYRSTHRYA